LGCAKSHHLRALSRKRHDVFIRVEIAMDDLGFWILVSVGIVLGAMLLIVIAGSFMSRSHKVTRAITLKQTPDAVWAVLVDFVNSPSWHSELAKVERMPDRNGHEVWKEIDKSNYGMFLETMEATPTTRLVRALVDDKGPFTGRWEFGIAPTETGCRLTITESGEIGNPFFRFIFRLTQKPEYYVELYLKELAKKFQESATVEAPRDG
jgi:hypothetical protein